MSQIAIFSARSSSLFDIDLFFWMHDHREGCRQTNTQSLSTLLLCVEQHKGKVAPYFPHSPRPVAFLSRALKYVQFSFSDAVCCWLKSRLKPYDLTPRAFFLVLGSSAVWWLRCKLIDQPLRGMWHRTVLAAHETIVINLSYARAQELMRCLFENIIFFHEC